VLETNASDMAPPTTLRVSLIMLGLLCWVVATSTVALGASHQGKALVCPPVNSSESLLDAFVWKGRRKMISW